MLRREAAGWLARLQSGRDLEIEQKFRRWYDRDRANASAFDRVSQSYSRAGLLRNSPLLSTTSDTAPRRPSRRMPHYAIAAALAAVVFIPACMLMAGGAPGLFGGMNAVMLTTRVGEIRQVTLPDGSKLTLDTNSSVELRIDSTHRRALLKHGRARFDVVPAGHPFVIEAGGTIVTIGEARLDVESAGQRSEIDLLGGSAKVLGSDPAQKSGLVLRPGEGVTSDPAHIAGKRIAAALSDWTSGMLQFDGTPLPAAVSLANRYSDRKIVAGAGLGNLRVTGAFRAGDTTRLASALAAAFELSLHSAADGNLVLERQDRSPQPKKEGG